MATNKGSEKTVNSKKIAAMALALITTAAVSVGVTLAFLTSKTDKVTNTFTGKSNLDVTIEEVFDKDSAADYAPGTSIQKEPYLVNTCSYDEYVSMQVGFYLYDNTGAAVEVTYPVFQSVVGTNAIAWNDTDWHQVSGDSAFTQFYYADGTDLIALTPGEQSPNLFTTVTPDADIETKIGTEFEGKDGNNYTLTGADTAGELPKFEIVVGGYAVSVDLSSGLADSDAESAAYQLKELMTANPVAGLAQAADNNNKFGA
ncbi:MAG: hypothetical protein Q4F95_06970 [Oscillospiraceae bacterium]|nr:hypothetical protein [Oscillospiraceae bacterium]